MSKSKAFDFFLRLLDEKDIHKVHDIATKKEDQILAIVNKFKRDVPHYRQVPRSELVRYFTHSERDFDAWKPISTSRNFPWNRSMASFNRKHSNRKRSSNRSNHSTKKRSSKSPAKNRSRSANRSRSRSANRMTGPNFSRVPQNKLENFLFDNK